jgi:hypothetical protein
MFVWFRVGDADDYHNFNNLQDAAEHLEGFGIKKVWRSKFCPHFGLDAEGYANYNYISAYWGNVEGDAVLDLTDDDIKELNNNLPQSQ